MRRAVAWRSPRHPRPHMTPSPRLGLGSEARARGRHAVRAGRRSSARQLREGGEGGASGRFTFARDGIYATCLCTYARPLGLLAGRVGSGAKLGQWSGGWCVQRCSPVSPSALCGVECGGGRPPCGRTAVRFSALCRLYHLQCAIRKKTERCLIRSTDILNLAADPLLVHTRRDREIHAR